MTPAERLTAAPVWLYGILAAALAITASAVWLMPCGADLQLWLLLVAAGVLTGCAYRAMPWRNNAGWAALIIFWAMLAVGVTANLHQWTVERWCTLEHPWMLNWDANDFRNQALLRMGLVPERPIYDLDYALTYDGVLAAFIWLFGRSIMYPMLGNMLMTLLAVVMSGWLAVRLLSHDGGTHSPAFKASAAIIMTGAIASYLNCGTVLIKDATLNCCTVAALLGLTALWNPPARLSRRAVMVVMMVIGLAGITIVRYQMLLMMLPAVAVAWRRRYWQSAIAVAAIIFILYFGVRSMVTTYSINEYTDTSIITERFFQERESHSTYLDMLGNYASMGFWKKLMWLPVCCAVQYLIPLPWNALADIPMGYTLAYAHQGWAWYLIGGCALYYLLLISWTNWRRSLLSRYVLWAAACFAGIAWMFGGTVSRYVLPFMPVFVAAAMYAWLRCRHRAAFRRFYAGYLVALAAALGVCWWLG